MARIVIDNAVIVNEGKKYKGHLIIDGDRIEAVGKGAAKGVIPSDEYIDACGAYVLPGAIDAHVHFREPGLTHKGDIATESAAAVAGGVTSVMEMPNTKPATVDMEAWQWKMDRAAEMSLANYAFYVAATNDNVELLCTLDYSLIPGVKLFLGSSTGNMLVDSESALTRIFAEVPALIAVHAEDEQRISANRARAKAVFGDEPVPMEFHSWIRDTMACYVSSKRAIELARRYDARLHLLHVSTAAEAGLLTPGPVSGKRITAETCIQYLWFTDKDYAELGSRIKCNPAVKADSDRRALWRAVADGRIDTIATDHAPHLLSEKSGDALTAPSGCPNIQFSLPMLFELALQKRFKIETLVERVAHAPAEIYGVEQRGYLRAGYYADVVMVSVCDEYEVTDGMSLSRCGWIPAAGAHLTHRVEATWVNGKCVYTHRSGIAAVSGNAVPLRFADHRR